MSAELNETFFAKVNQEIIEKKIMGSCDNCHKLMYTGDTIYQNIDLKHTHFNLEFCNKFCYDTKQIEHPFIEEYSYETVTIVEKDKSKSLSTLLSFMIRYPWTFFWSFRYGSVSVLEYILDVQRKKNLDEKEKIFLDNCKKYNLI